MSLLERACALLAVLAAIAAVVSACSAAAAARRVRRLLAARPERVLPRTPGDGGAGDRLMGRLRQFQGERFSVPMSAGRRSGAAAR